MEWDKVKGFFRRTTQYINQNIRHTVEPTVDTEYDNLVTIVEGLQGVAVRTSERLKRLAMAVDAQVAIVHEASLDPPAQQFIWEDMQKLNTKLSHAASSLQPHSSYAKKIFLDHAVQLDRYVSDCKMLETLKEDRKTALLEYDFFRVKTAELRATPPQDPQRIPRNEGRVMEFKTKVDGISAKLKQALQGLMSSGERLCSTAHALMSSELHRFSDESSRAWVGANQAVQTSASIALNMPVPPPPATNAQAAAAHAAVASQPSSSTAGGGAAKQPSDGLPQPAKLAAPPPQPTSAPAAAAPAGAAPTTAAAAGGGGGSQQQQQQDNKQSESLNSTLDSTTYNAMSGTYGADPNRPPPVNANPVSRRNLAATQADDPFRM